MAIQHGQAIFNLQASFHTDEDGLDYQVPMPDAPDPESLPDFRTRMAPYKDVLGDWYDRPRPIDLRYVGAVAARAPGPRRPHAAGVAARRRRSCPTIPVLHACIVTYASDMTLLDTTLLPHGVSWTDQNVQMASLDHAMWFHRSFRADEWLLYDQGTPSTSHARGLALGSIFTQDGRMVVSVVQEGLVRVVVVTQGRRAALAAVAVARPAACGSGRERVPGAPTPFPVQTTAAAPATTASRHDRNGAVTHDGRRRPPARRSGGSLAGAKIQLSEVATLDQPIALGLAARTTRPSTSPSGAASIRAVRDGAVGPGRSSTSARSRSAGGERGLLGAAFSPDGRYLYVNYTDTQRRHQRRRAGRRAPTAQVDASSRRRVLFQDQPYPNHNGGSLVFGPDGYLYIGLGRRRLGRRPAAPGAAPRHLARQDPAHRPPAVRRPARTGCRPTTRSSARPAPCPEIWSYGLRNPWRFSFDAATGDLWIGDVGQSAIEEVDEAPGDGGPRCRQGPELRLERLRGHARYNDDQPADGTVGPVYEYRHTDTLGGLRHHRRLRLSRPDDPRAHRDVPLRRLLRRRRPGHPDRRGQPDRTLLSATPGSIASFGEDAEDELYVLSLGGPLYRIDPA